MAPATSNSRPSRWPSSARPEPPERTAFRGWPPEAIHFWEGLEADNSRMYWTAHRQLYEDAVRAPMEALGLACADIGPFRIFRPYRDVRFSRDKSPYKTHIGAVTESEGGTAYYVQHSAAGLFVAARLFGSVELAGLGAAAAAAGGLMGDGDGAGPGAEEPLAVQRVVSDRDKIGRNDPCWCGSGKKFKKCHGAA